MKLIKCILKSHELEEAMPLLTQMGVVGWTITRVRGYPTAPGATESRRRDYSTLQPQFMLDCVVHDEIADTLVRTIAEAARMKRIGGSDVFILPIDEGYHIRTGWLER